MNLTKYRSKVKQKLYEEFTEIIRKNLIESIKSFGIEGSLFEVESRVKKL